MSSVPWPRRLGVRLAAAVTSVGVAVLGISGALLIRSQQQHLTTQALRTAAIVSDTVTSSIHNDMLIDRRLEAYRAMDGIGGKLPLDRLRVIDSVGKIAYSRDPREIGQRVDPRDAACKPCHRADAPSAQALITAEGRAHITERNGRRVLGAITPLYNESSCSTASCHAHPASQAVLGILELSMPLDAVDAESLVLRRTTAVLLALSALVLAGLTLLFIRRMVEGPVLQLVSATSRVASGDWNAGIEVVGSDELSVLQRSFNAMVESRAAARAERDELLASLERQVADRTEALHQAQARLVQTEKLSSLGRLSASIAHEINNPLAGILTTAKLLIRMVDAEPTPEWKANFTKRLSLVQRETERCSAIVRNLLGFARERPLTLGEVDLNAVVEEALFLANNQIALQNIQLRHVRADVPVVRADFGQVRQAVANVVLNACDAMTKGGRLDVETFVSATGKPGVRVTDTGGGIPRELLTKVLDPFFTTKEKGTGLGLSVVYGIVERHGGRLDIQSEEGVGTCVTIEIGSPPEDAGARA